MEKTKKVIHVNMHKIRSNNKTGNREPVLTVKGHKQKKNGQFNKPHQANDYCHEAVIDGPCKVIYSPDNPLSCGARVWIETESDVICVIR
jgi:hypothetical protein